MPTLPDPKSPLSKMDRLVFGDTVRHPATGLPISRSVNSTDHQTLTPNEEARRVHLPMIRHEFGAVVAAEIEQKLDEYERDHGEPAVPAKSLPLGFERALMKG